MADALVARVTGQGSAGAGPVCVNLTMDADAFLGSGYAESLPSWRSSSVGEGNGPPVAVVTTTPTGHVYESGRGP